ncbi:MAG: hypothetical protein IK142_00340 [Clostridiales bacterium]|jgi:hypothetical protein|nr:hypothetical protein [Clostridiales bacterium]MCR5201351.1 hypothetical protein [Saccharofermentans sp.]
MSPLDMSVLLFFVLIFAKAVKDSCDHWKEMDEIATAEYRKAHTTSSRQRVSTVDKKTEVVTRTPVRVPYRVYRVDSIRSASVPAPYKRKLPSSRGAGRQMETAA